MATCGDWCGGCYACMRDDDDDGVVGKTKARELDPRCGAKKMYGTVVLTDDEVEALPHVPDCRCKR